MNQINRQLPSHLLAADGPDGVACASISYDLEYGQIHPDAVGDSHRVLIADEVVGVDAYVPVLPS